MDRVPGNIGMENLSWSALGREAAIKAGTWVITFCKKEVMLQAKVGVFAIAAIVSLVFIAYTYFTRKNNTKLQAEVDGLKGTIAEMKQGQCAECVDLTNEISKTQQERDRAIGVAKLFRRELEKTRAKMEQNEVFTNSVSKALEEEALVQALEVFGEALSEEAPLVVVDPIYVKEEKPSLVDKELAKGLAKLDSFKNPFVGLGVELPEVRLGGTTFEALSGR